MMRQTRSPGQLDQFHRADRSGGQNGEFRIPGACKLVLAPEGCPQWTGLCVSRRSGHAHERLRWKP